MWPDPTWHIDTPNSDKMEHKSQINHKLIYAPLVPFKKQISADNLRED
jgi:hypothetical protein